MRKLGFALLYLGFVWIALLQFNLTANSGLRPVVLAQYEKLSKDPNYRYTSEEAQFHIRDTALAVQSHFPIVIAPGAVMLLGGLLIGFGSRRRTKTSAA